MTLSMFQASVPVFERMLTNLASILEKAASYAETKKIDPSIFLNARLAPDMFSLSRQVQIATDAAKGCAARLAGIDIPSFPDNEVTFADLQERIKKTISFVKSVKPEQIDGSEDKTVTLKIGGKDINLKGQFYLLSFVLPNLYFHIAVAYSILRHNGLEVGKMDYLGQPPK